VGENEKASESLWESLGSGSLQKKKGADMDRLKIFARDGLHPVSHSIDQCPITFSITYILAKS